MTKTTIGETDARMPAIYVGWAAAGLFGLFALALALGLEVAGLSWFAWPHIATAAVLLFTGSEGYHAVRKDRRRRLIEERFPDLLRSLATNHASGLTVAASIKTAAEGDFGALNPEIRRMAAQISFHTPVDVALQGFADRVNSPLVSRSVGLLQDAMRSGSRTTEALHAAAGDAGRIKDLEEQRSAGLSQYVAIVYVAFLVFMLVVVVMAYYFVGTVFSADTSPDTRVDVSSVFADPTIEQSFHALFIWAGTITGAGGGLVIGALVRGRPMTALHHSFALTAIGYVTMAIVIAIY